MIRRKETHAAIAARSGAPVAADSGEADTVALTGPTSATLGTPPRDARPPNLRTSEPQIAEGVHMTEIKRSIRNPKTFTAIIVPVALTAAAGTYFVTGMLFA